MRFVDVVSAPAPALALALALGLAGLAACDPVKMPHEEPGPPGCGTREPAVSGPSTMSVAQNTTLRSQGMPGVTELNEHGGRNWIYIRQVGSVFGESETAEIFIFNDKGLLVGQKTEVRKQVGK